MPAVSYAVTVYNKAPFLPSVLAAVEAERAGTGGEIVVVDDGSTDGSGAMLDAYAAGRDAVRVLRQENRGVAAATNAVLRAARGDFVRLVDGDDFIAPGSTRLLMRVVEETGADFAFGRFVLCDPGSAGGLPAVRGDARATTIADPLADIFRMHIAPSATLGRRAFYERLPPLPERYRTSQDIALALLVARRGRLAWVDEPVCYVTTNPGRLSADPARMYRETALIIRDLMTDWPVRYQAPAVRRNAGRAYHYARRHMPGSRLRQASLLAIKLLAYLPLAPIFPASMSWIASTYDRPAGAPPGG